MALRGPAARKPPLGGQLALRGHGGRGSAADGCFGMPEAGSAAGWRSYALRTRGCALGHRALPLRGMARVHARCAVAILMGRLGRHYTRAGRAHMIEATTLFNLQICKFANGQFSVSVTSTNYTGADGISG